MLAWVMDLGFAASNGTAVAATPLNSAFLLLGTGLLTMFLVVTSG